MHSHATSGPLTTLLSVFQEQKALEHTLLHVNKPLMQKAANYKTLDRITQGTNKDQEYGVQLS